MANRNKNQQTEQKTQESTETSEVETQEVQQETQEVQDTQQVPSEETKTEETKPAETKTEELVKSVETTSEKLSGLATRLNEYVTAMAPNRPMDAKEIQTQQMKLRGIIRSLLKTDAEDFKDAMKLVVNTIRDHRDGVFSERLVFRGFPQMKLARSERQSMETLISLLLATADAQQPSKVTDVVDMNVVFRYVTDDDQQQKLQSYYGM